MYNTFKALAKTKKGGGGGRVPKNIDETNTRVCNTYGIVGFLTVRKGWNFDENGR